MPHRPFTLSLTLLTPVLLLLAFGAATSVAQRDEPACAAMANTLTHQRDLVVNGATLPALAGAAWQQLPFQFDEVDPVSNSYVITGDGSLDPADELAFLAQDAGQWGWSR